MVFSTAEKSFMIESYFRNGRKVDGEWQYSIQSCLEEFQEQFPNVAIDFDSFRKTLHTCIRLFRQTGDVCVKKSGGRPKKRTNEVIENVREVMDAAPSTSIRVLSQQTDLSYGTCQTIIKKDLHLFPYRLQCFQQLLPIDRPRRVEYCEWFMNTINNDATLNITFYSDEAWFHLSGYVNSQNMRMWSAVNPHFNIEAPLHPQKIGVWAAISRQRIIGPYFFEGKK